MDVGVFERWASKWCPTKEIVAGLEACGDRPVLQNPDVWKAEEGEFFPASIVNGAREKPKEIADWMRARGGKVAVIEQGYIRRPIFYQFGVDGLCWLPSDEQPDDRRLAHRIERPVRIENDDGYILVLGQVPADAQHEIRNIKGWLMEVLTKLRERTDRKIVLRPHPVDEEGSTIDGFDEIHPPRERDLYKHSFKGAWAVVTHNSTAGLLAAIHGLPVFCSPTAMYAPICNTDLARIEKPKQVRKFNQLLNRICYAQWNSYEFATGKAWRFLKPYLFNGKSENGNR